MGNGIVEIRAQVCAMIEADEEMLSRLDAAGAEGQWLLECIRRTLDAHVEELSVHVRRLGGAPPAIEVSPKARASSLARLLRDFYTMISLAHARALVLETDARAHGYSSSAAMATRHREELVTLLAAIRDELPGAVKEEIEQTRIPT